MFATSPLNVAESQTERLFSETFFMCNNFGKQHILPLQYTSHTNYILKNLQFKDKSNIYK